MPAQDDDHDLTMMSIIKTICMTPMMIMIMRALVMLITNEYLSGN